MASMHFWGIDVKGKEPSSVKLEEGQVIHLSQATLGELKKDSEPVILHVKVGDKKLVLGILSQNNPQLSFDLVFNEDFEISHNWKNGSVHFLGYQPDMQDEDDFSDFSEDDDVPVPIPIRENGKAPAAAKAAAKPNKDDKAKPEEKADEDDESDDDDDDEDGEDDSSDEDMLGASDESGEEGSEDDDDDDDDESDEEETPKAEVGKKRSKPDAKTPEPKKAKVVTPQKTDGKKGGAHTATPHPSKKGGKTPAGDKQTPKSGGQLSCGSCKKNFNSENALLSHNRAKHAAK